MPLVNFRMSTGTIAQVDKWAASQSNRPDRSEALRRLVDIALATESRSTARPSATSAARASDMAGTEIDRQADQSASVEERDKRKRRLLKGPREFRGYRSDHK